MKKEAQDLSDLLCEHKMKFHEDDNSSFGHWRIGLAKTEREFNNSILDVKDNIKNPDTLYIVDQGRIDILQEVYEDLKFYGCRSYNEEKAGRFLFFFREG